MKKYALLSLAAVTLWLQYSLIFGNHGIKKGVLLKNTISRMEDENGKIKIKNERLKKQIQEIKNNPDKMNKILRGFFMIKENEVFIMPYTPPNKS